MECPAYAGEPSNLITFKIDAGDLDSALREFSEQAAVQLLYKQSAVSTRHSPPVAESLTVAAALDKLLSGTDLIWRYTNDHTVAIVAPVVEDAPTAAAVHHSVMDNMVTVLADVDVTAHQPWWSEAGGETEYGLPKPIMEIPRAVSHISGDAIDYFSLSAVEDMVRVVPGVFTTTRFGVQGSVDIRNVPADTYFRGMKRLTLQGHGRSVLAAMDAIDVVGGPASPLHGLGKIGGYVNLVPKSGRSRTGQYLTEPHGFVQAITGQYQRREVSVGVGGPLSLDSIQRKGGYYLYGLVEDSNSYAVGVPVKQEVLQAATSVDNIVGPLRLEAGINYQRSRTAGALMGRLTQDLVDRRRYIGGAPLVHLDLNGNGSIGLLEMNSASPVHGELAVFNQPLQQIFPWPLGSDGQPLPLEQFPKLTGIPASLYDYLSANPEADPGGLLRAQGIGGPLPSSGLVPVGMALDPRTIKFTEYDPHRSSAFEKNLQAEFFTFYADLVMDADPGFTVKNQFFFDSMDQYKSSNQPFSQVQDVYVVEDKLTLTNRLDSLPPWLRMDQVFSVNARNTVSKGMSTLGDYGNHRTDAAAANWNATDGGMTANTTFSSSNENPDLSADGLPWGSLYRTEYSELGIAMLFDVFLGSRTNVLVGARVDGSRAKNVDYAGRYTFSTGTSADPGRHEIADAVAEGWDSGASWSISASQQLPFGLRPYGTYSRSSILLDGNNNSLENEVIAAGHIGAAELKEVGLKGVWDDGRLSLAIAAYEQGRIDVDSHDDPAVINVYATATTTRGAHAEIKWAPRHNLSLSMYLLRQITRYTPNIGGPIQTDARALGFVDVVDADGEVIYPAEAFLYGGRARIRLPNGMAQYERKQGNPEYQAGLAAVYRAGEHWGLTLTGNYLSKTRSGRLCTVELPASLVVDAGVFWTSPLLDVKVDVSNLGDELYFRARTGDTLGDAIAQVMPGRTAQLTVTFKF